MGGEMTNKTREVAEKLFAENKMAKALVHFEILASENQNDAIVNMKLGTCQFRTDDFSAAEKSFHKVVQLQIKNHMAWYYLGLSQERQDNTSDAKIAYKFALAIKPDFKEALQKLGLETDKPKNPKKDSTVSDDLANSGMTKGLFTQEKSAFVFWAERLTHIFIGLVVYGGVFGGIAGFFGHIATGNEFLAIVVGLCVGGIVGILMAIIGAGKVSRVI